MNEEDRKYIDKALEKIVPSRELCEQIPAGEFADSALSWYRDMRYQGSIDLIPSFLGVEKRRIPAPTLAEILREMANAPMWFQVVTLDADKDDDYSVSAFVSYREKPGSSLKDYKSDNPADAALRLWLEVKGRRS